MIFKYLVLVLASAVLIAGTAEAADKKLFVVNGLGETLDLVDMNDSTTALNLDELGLYPNDFIVAGNRGVVINSGSNDLYFYDLATLTRVDQLFLGDGRNPYIGAVLSDDTLYITNLVASTVSKVQVSTGSLITEIPVGDSEDTDSPQGIIIRERRAYICLTSFNALFEYDQGKVEVWDLDADTMLARIGVGVNPQIARFGYDGFLYVVCTGNYANIEGRLFKIDPVSLAAVDSLYIGGTPGSVAITKNGIAFLTAGGWPPPLAVDGKGRRYEDRRIEKAPTSGGLVFTVNLESWAVLHGPANPVLTAWGTTAILTVSDSTVVVCNFADDTITEIDSSGAVYSIFATGDGPTAVAKSPSCFVPIGDADGNGIITISDAVALISYIFGGGPEPAVAGSGDADCNNIITISDAVHLITFIFGGGPGTCGCAD